MARSSSEARRAQEGQPRRTPQEPGAPQEQQPGPRRNQSAQQPPPQRSGGRATPPAASPSAPPREAPARRAQPKQPTKQSTKQPAKQRTGAQPQRGGGRKARSDDAAPTRVRRRRPPAVAPVRSLSERRYRQRITRLDLWSVAKVAVCFYLSALIVTLVAGIVVWLIASGAGAVGNFETFMRDAGFDDFRFLSGQILRGGVLIGLAIVAVLTVITLVAAALYNLFAELIGGVEVLVREEEAIHGD